MNKLQLWYPANPYKLNQPFGMNDACTENTPTVPIAKRKIVGKSGGTCPANYVELYPLLGMKGHTGADLKASHGQPIYYAGPPGTVQEVQTEVERGLGVGIITDDVFDINGLEAHAKTRYWHLMGISVSLGQKLATGDLIGIADTTGLSAGDHLHFELKPVSYDPGSGWFNLLQNNGYFGAIDPVPFFTGIPAMNVAIQVKLNLIQTAINWIIKQLSKVVPNK